VSNCPNKSHGKIDIVVDEKVEVNKTHPIDDDEPWPFKYMCKEPTLRIVGFVNVDTKGTSKCVYLSAVINDKSVLCMCDADSDVNFVPYDLIYPKLIKPTALKFYAANGTTIGILGLAQVTVHLANRVKFDAEFLISERVACPMFGTSMAKKKLPPLGILPAGS